MTSSITAGSLHALHPVDVHVTPALDERNRLTCAFRFLLAIPHLLLVGGPMAFGMTWFGSSGDDAPFHWGSAGVLGAVAAVIALIAWFAIVFTGTFPRGLWNLSAMYLRWRVRAVAYLMLLRDEYPPFGEGAYPATLTLPEPDEPRDRLTVAFRIFLVIPHLLVLWVLGISWAHGSPSCSPAGIRRRSTRSPWACCGGPHAWKRTCCSCATSIRRSRWSRATKNRGRGLPRGERFQSFNDSTFQRISSRCPRPPFNVYASSASRFPTHMKWKRGGSPPFA